MRPLERTHLFGNSMVFCGLHATSVDDKNFLKLINNSALPKSFITLNGGDYEVIFIYNRKSVFAQNELNVPIGKSIVKLKLPSTTEINVFNKQFSNNSQKDKT